MTLLLEGKVAAVTGGGRGVARGVAIELAKAGADIAVVDIDADNAQKVAGDSRVELLNVDSAIIFSDILVVPNAMGMALRVDDGVGPRFADPIRSPSDLARLHHVEPEDDLRYTLDAIRLLPDTDMSCAASFANRRKL